MQIVNVDDKSDGKKLITFLTTVFPELRISTVHKALRKKDIRINDKRVNEDTVLSSGDVIKVFIADELLYGQKNNKYDYNYSIVYQDDNILVVDKEQGIEVVGEKSLTSQLKKEFEFIEPCHRIDRNTSGIVLFAKNSNSLNAILGMFRENQIEKHYIACCYGLAKKQDTVEAYLFKDRKKSMVYISETPKKGYVPIKTSYKTIKQDTRKKLSLLDVTLHTGRTHQIRAHLASINLPIIGDGKYGSYSINNEYKQNKQLLCSYSLTFRNITNDKLIYLNERTIKLSQIPYLDYFDKEK